MRSCQSVRRLIVLGALLCWSGARAAESVAVPLEGLHPRPQFKRDPWMNLNGPWDFDFDRPDAGLREHWYIEHAWSRTIIVPYVHQCELSGIGDTAEWRSVKRFAGSHSLDGQRNAYELWRAAFAARRRPQYLYK